jgi:hypothetical protein
VTVVETFYDATTLRVFLSLQIISYSVSAKVNMESASINNCVREMEAIKGLDTKPYPYLATKSSAAILRHHTTFSFEAEQVY